VPYLIHYLPVDRNPTARLHVDPNSYRSHLLIILY
jgi:hypothetical protein